MSRPRFEYGFSLRLTGVEKLQVGLASVKTTIEQIRVRMEAEQAAREKQEAQFHLTRTAIVPPRVSVVGLIAWGCIAVGLVLLVYNCAAA